MARNSRDRTRCVSVPLLTLLLLGTALPARGQDAPGGGERAVAIDLCRRHKDLEALPLLEKCHKADPSDREVKERLACALVATVITLPEDAQAATLVRARKMLVELKDDGPLSNLGEILLGMIPEDGKLAIGGRDRDVAAAMKAGEEAFARRDFARARASYETALAREPKLYAAAVFAGDTWFAEGKMDEAIAWFARAAEIGPDEATAYRYWGDALMKQKKPAEARDKFLEAIVAEPYSRPSWIGLKQWADATSSGISHPRVMPPDPKPGQDRKVAPDDGTTHVVLYDATRAAWKERLFKSAYPDEPKYRHTLKEEAEALHDVARAFSAAVKDGKVPAPDPTLVQLAAIDDAGLLEAYVLLARPDDGIAADYPAYRAKNRDKLRAYLKAYVAPFPAGDGAKPQ